MKHPMGTAAFSLFLLTLGACQNPQYMNGRRVIGSHWKDGHIVYVLEPNEEDRTAFKEALKESEAAAREVTFRPAGN